MLQFHNFQHCESSDLAIPPQVITDCLSGGNYLASEGYVLHCIKLPQCFYRSDRLDPPVPLGAFYCSFPVKMIVPHESVNRLSHLELSGFFIHGS